MLGQAAHKPLKHLVAPRSAKFTPNELELLSQGQKDHWFSDEIFQLKFVLHWQPRRKLLRIFFYFATLFGVVACLLACQNIQQVSLLTL